MGTTEEIGHVRMLKWLLLFMVVFGVLVTVIGCIILHSLLSVTRVCMPVACFLELLDFGVFLSAIWLTHDQCWVIIEGTASRTQC